MPFCPIDAMLKIEEDRLMRDSEQVPVQRLDAVIVGAGLNGLYQTHRLKSVGLEAVTLEAGPDIGGVWYWNRYPGARVDSHFPFYQYFFSQELWDSADWSERFPDQEQIERYFHKFAEQYDLRERIKLNTRVVNANYNEESGRWLVETDTGSRLDAQFLILCTGGLSTPKTPDYAGLGNFKGKVCHTSRWPKDGVDLTGKRVGVVGTAATGIQVIQTIAPVVAQLTVFQRTPNYAVAMRNEELTQDDLAAMAERRSELHQRTHESFGGFVYDSDAPMFDDVPEGERLRRLEEVWADGSLQMWGNTFADAFHNDVAAEFISDFVRKKIRSRIDDPANAEKLVPRDYLFGSRRVPLENGYYDTFNRDNVELVDLRSTPVSECDDTAIITSDGHRHELDVIIFATGFDAGTGAINQIDIRGKDGRSLREQWKQRVSTTMGMQVHGFPNLFMTMAPFSPASAVCNMPTCAEQQVNWITDTIGHVLDQGKQTIEPNVETEEAWMRHHREVSEPTIIGRNNNSWYRLKDRDGQERELLAYVGGVGPYRDACEEVRANGYPGFSLS